MFLSQYDEAREFVDRARKCLATELAALVSNPTPLTQTKKLNSIVYLTTY